MLRTVFAALTIATLLAACATPPPAPPPQPSSPTPPPLPRFQGAQPPDPGKARLYVFRPKAEDQALHYEQPILRADQTEITPLPEASFADLQLPPGRHTLSLVPPEGGSDLWRTRVTLNFRPDSITYLAVWMAEGFERTPSGNHGADTLLLVLPVGNPEDTPAHLRVERAAPDIAEPILRQCCGRVFPPAAAPARNTRR